MTLKLYQHLANQFCDQMGYVDLDKAKLRTEHFNTFIEATRVILDALEKREYLDPEDRKAFMVEKAPFRPEGPETVS